MKPAHEDKKRPPLYRIGRVVMIFGIVTTTMFTGRQIKESGTGHTYYEFIVGGIILAVIGLATMAVRRGNRQNP